MSVLTAPEVFQTPATICMLCYGDHPALAQRCLSSLHRHSNRATLRLRIGLNAVSAATEQVLERWLPRFNVDLVVRSEVNLFKNPMMRHLFHDRKIETPWTLWLDDDSFVFRDDWLAMLQYESALQPQVDMWGRKCFIRGNQRHREFIQAASWYRGQALEADPREGGCRLHFVVGGFWALRTRWLYHLNWPDARLVHFGEDYILGEALRQNGGVIGNAFSGVAIDRAPRRAPPDAPRCEVLR